MVSETIPMVRGLACAWCLGLAIMQIQKDEQVLAYAAQSATGKLVYPMAD